MLALWSVAAACALVEPDPGYTIHVRELTSAERVVRVTLMGDEAVLDAVGRLRLPDERLAEMDLWIVRPGPAGERQVLRVDRLGLTQRGQTRTNFALLRGDRLFLQQRVAE